MQSTHPSLSPPPASSTHPPSPSLAGIVGVKSPLFRIDKALKAVQEALIDGQLGEDVRWSGWVGRRIWSAVPSCSSLSGG